jgi:hypothetical protein
MDLLGILTNGAVVLGGLKALNEALQTPRQPPPPLADLGRGSLPGDKRFRPRGRPALPAHQRSSFKPMTQHVHTVRNINQRVSHIVKLIKSSSEDQNIRRLSVQLVSQKRNGKWVIPERDYKGECTAIFNFVRSRVRYVRDAHHMDTFQSAMRTLEFGGGDCDDYTIVLGAMLRSIGYPVWCRVIQTPGSADWSHIYLVAGVPPHAPNKQTGMSMVLDGSVNKPAGWSPPRSMIMRQKDFEVR